MSAIRSITLGLIAAAALVFAAPAAATAAAAVTDPGASTMIVTGDPWGCC